MRSASPRTTVRRLRRNSRRSASQATSSSSYAWIAIASSMQRSSSSNAAGRCSGRSRWTRSSDGTPLKKSRSALCMTLPLMRASSGCSTSRGESLRSTNQSDEQVWNVSSSVTEYVGWPARRASTSGSRRRVGRRHAASARSTRATARPPCARGPRERRRLVVARERGDGLQPLALVVAVEGVRGPC